MPFSSRLVCLLFHPSSDENSVCPLVHSIASPSSHGYLIRLVLRSVPAPRSRACVELVKMAHGIINLLPVPSHPSHSLRSSPRLSTRVAERFSLLTVLLVGAAHPSLPSCGLCGLVVLAVYRCYRPWVGSPCPPVILGLPCVVLAPPVLPSCRSPWPHPLIAPRPVPSIRRAGSRSGACACGVGERCFRVRTVWYHHASLSPVAGGVVLALCFPCRLLLWARSSSLVINPLACGTPLLASWLSCLLSPPSRSSCCSAVRFASLRCSPRFSISGAVRRLVVFALGLACRLCRCLSSRGVWCRVRMACYHPGSFSSCGCFMLIVWLGRVLAVLVVYWYC